MIRKSIVKWVAAGALALGTVPAIGLARHSTHVSAALPSLSAVKTSTPVTAKKTSKKLISHTVKPSTHVTKGTTHSTKLSTHKKLTPAKKTAHTRSSTHKHVTTHRHTPVKKSTGKKHS